MCQAWDLVAAVQKVDFRVKLPERNVLRKGCLWGKVFLDECMITALTNLISFPDVLRALSLMWKYLYHIMGVLWVIHFRALVKETLHSQALRRLARSELYYS